MIPPRLRAGCVECDDRPLCPPPGCGRPLQLGEPVGFLRPCPEPYRRGLIWAFDTEEELAAWLAGHPPGHAGFWVLRVLQATPPPPAA